MSSSAQYSTGRRVKERGRKSKEIKVTIAEYGFGIGSNQLQKTWGTATFFGQKD